MTDENTILWNLYVENWTQARHHETQRSTMSSIVIIISGTIVTLVTSDKCVNIYDLPLSFLLTVLGTFGIFFSAKQYERSQKHIERARGYRATLDKALPNARINASKEESDTITKRLFPRLATHRLNFIWTVLHVLLMLLGATLLITSLLHGATPCDTQTAPSLSLRQLTETAFGDAVISSPRHCATHRPIAIITL